MKNLCFIGNSHLSQFSLDKLNVQGFLTCQVIYCTGASIKGLCNPDSKLQLKKQILDFQNLNPDYTLVFFLGQVDIEFGYYYKCTIDNKKHDVHDYIISLIKKYESFLSKELTNPFVILSINPTVIRNIEHNFNVSFKCPNGNNGFYSEENPDILFENYKDTIYNDSYEVRYKNNKLFNEELNKMCEKNKYKYINFWEMVLDSAGNVKEEYMPKNENDHHLCKNGFKLLKFIYSKL
jgi:hypothetical protein